MQTYIEQERLGRLNQQLSNILCRGTFTNEEMAQLVAEHGQEDVEWMVNVLREDRLGVSPCTV